MWEYYVHQCSNVGVPLGKGESHAERFQDGLNQFGALGWELVCHIDNQLIFKRRRAAFYDPNVIPRHEGHFPDFKTE